MGALISKTGAGISAAQQEAVKTAAAALLARATTTQLANPFGSIGELSHAVYMWEKFGGDLVGVVVSALARIAGQRELANCDPFVWDDERVTYFIDVERLEVMSSKLASAEHH